MSLMQRTLADRIPNADVQALKIPCCPMEKGVSLWLDFVLKVSSLGKTQFSTPTTFVTDSNWNKREDVMTTFVSAQSKYL